jgi:hypothetical protein
MASLPAKSKKVSVIRFLLFIMAAGCVQFFSNLSNAKSTIEIASVVKNENIEAQSDNKQSKDFHLELVQFSGCNELENILNERQNIAVQASQITSNKNLYTACKILSHYSEINSKAREALTRDGAWCRKPDSFLEQITAAQGQIDIAKNNWCEAANNKARQEKIARQRQQQQTQAENSEEDDGTTACQLGWFIAQLACMSLKGPTSGIDQMNCMTRMIQNSNRQCQ